MEISGTFLCSGYVSRRAKRFGLNLLKLELFKDKNLVRISFLRHIQLENRPISCAFNARQKEIKSKTPKVTPVNINK